MSAPRPVVVKFGGASLGNVTRILERLRELQAGREPVVLVVSAREGVTDLLTEVLASPRAVDRHRAIYARITQIHPGLPEAGVAHLRTLRVLIARVERGRPGDLPLGDRLLSLGERLAAHWLGQRMREGGLPAVPVEADRLGLVTDNAYGASCILLERSRKRVLGGISRLLREGKIPVVTGYFGRSLEGRVAVLGRGGSDYSASAIGAMIGARRVELVKRRVAVFTADPRYVPQARHVERLSYEEAEEMAQFGASVLHPLTIEPARQAGVEIQVRCLEDPGTVTTITSSDPALRTRAITLLKSLHLARVRVPSGSQRPGIVAAVSDELAHARINMVALFTSSALLTLVLEPGHTRQAIQAIAPLTTESAIHVEGPFPVALLTAIGDGVMADLGKIPLPILRASLGFSATSRSLSLAVPATMGEPALKALHAALVEGG